MTVGLFDGVHRGHQSLLRELGQWAEELGAAPAVVTFESHPLQLLRGRAPLQVLSLRHRLWLLAREGVQTTLVLPFTKELSLLSPEEFVERVAKQALGARGLLFGFDTAFGHDRKGTYEYLSARSADLGVLVRRASVEKVEGDRVSSTLVRQAVLEGDLARVERLLGRPLSILGKVTRGDGRGRTLGFPTANLDVEGAALPPAGVYFARVIQRKGAGDVGLDAPSLDLSELDPTADTGSFRDALVNVGKCPTFRDSHVQGTVETVEAHLLDFSDDLYGACLEIELLHRHRPEARFPSADALVSQIRSDVAAFEAYRARTASPSR